MSDDTGRLQSDLESRIERGLNDRLSEEDVVEVLDVLKSKYGED